jgi:hypothetical protein
MPYWFGRIGLDGNNTGNWSFQNRPDQYGQLILPACPGTHSFDSLFYFYCPESNTGNYNRS